MTDSTLMTLVRAYAAAKSAQDVAGALAVCHDDVVLDLAALAAQLGLSADHLAATLAPLGTSAAA